MKGFTRVSLLASLAVLLLYLAFAVSSASATDHIVGGNRGWNSGLNYTDWVNNQTFVVEDWISFRYQKDQHNVLQVNKTDYDNCTMNDIMGNWSSGKDFIELNYSKRYYFIDGKGGCFGGMKVTLFVDKAAPPPSSHNSGMENERSKSTGCKLQPVGLTLSGILMLGGALLGL